MKALIDEWFILTTIDEVAKGIESSKSKTIVQYFLQTLLNDGVIIKVVSIDLDRFKVFFRDGRAVVFDYDGDVFD